MLRSLIKKKAFDSVDRDKLWTIMLSKGIPTNLITIIQKIYMENIIRVIVFKLPPCSKCNLFISG